ncbi:hypothetical protein A1O7_07138 [Cladophialophora yegresii CBS 114405]|uniref:Uncharacterized protein n=1 Tax=Cladophialophora yegresii CBS 114405 TaxID=1182544 RepID=W9WE33_9EURO|nr:uncharacterized protein A1O7_07138 [Cladophialophora yegresii CBS 114405]EXJ56794.1 hypothetical protein A1O7_07138 [Cladophialophora yegresii CBS 114405]
MADEATKAKLRAKFDKLTPQDFAAVAGNRDALTKKVAEIYGISEDEAKKQTTAKHSDSRRVEHLVIVNIRVPVTEPYLQGPAIAEESQKLRFTP